MYGPAILRVLMDRLPAKRGRKPDNRPQLEFRVLQETFDALEALQIETGMTADENAAMLLHMVIRDPENVAARFKALAGKSETRKLEN
jgi:hypothetical protein